jgi:hypothetical protein
MGPPPERVEVADDDVAVLQGAGFDPQSPNNWDAVKATLRLGGVTPAPDMAIGEVVAILRRKAHLEADTKDDTPEKSEKRRRPMNPQARRCAKRYRKERKQGRKLTIRQIVLADVERYGGSVESVLRTLNDNPEDWKHDTRPT